MSNEKFDSHIRNKLREHVPDYDQQAWQQFQKLLPQPWYVQLFGSQAGWLFGGIASTALLASLIFYNLKTKSLNDKIITLENANQVAQVDTVFVNQTVRDTVYITQIVKEPVFTENASQKMREDYGVGSKTLQKRNVASPESPSFISEQERTVTEVTQQSIEPESTSKTPKTENSKGVNSSIDFQKEESDFTAEKANTIKQMANERSVDESQKAAMVKENTILSEHNGVKDSGQNLTVDTSTDASKDGTMPSSYTSGQSTVEDSKTLQTSEKVKDTNTEMPIVIQEPQLSVIDSLMAKDSLLPLEVELLDELKKTKKSLKMPVLRVGLESDLIGLRNLATGPTAEVFLGRKFSFNTGLLIAKLQTDVHPMLTDYNRHTGKDFRYEFQKYGGFQTNDPRPIRDININTTLLKVPLYFNYYIDTWSRFNFIISAGTKLDVSVYQDVQFKSGIQGDEDWKRFEAKPKPKVFNNFFYGTGVQYKYKQFVGQAMPYFDFNFRNTGYSNNIGRVGFVGSIKYQIGK